MKFMQWIRQLSIALGAFFFSVCAHASYPLWTFTQDPNHPAQISMNSTQTDFVVYTVSNQSKKSKSLLMQPIPGVVQTSPCHLNPIGQTGSSCSLLLAVTGNALPSKGVHGGPILCEANANGTPNANQCYRPSAADRLNITLTQPSAGVTISVDPFIVLFPINSSDTVTVTNAGSSSGAANDLTPVIPSGSGITYTTTCGASLPVGQSCTMTFFSTTIQGVTTIPIQGTNTNTVNLYVGISDQPLLNITGPAQQSRIVSTDGSTTLYLEVMNDPDSLASVTNVTVTDKTACPLLTVVPNPNCSSVAPGQTCQIALTTTTPYAPCTLTISGTGAGNSPRTLVAFSHLGGLVFEKTGAAGKVVSDVAAEFTSEWTFPGESDISSAMSDVDGVSNTNAIVGNYDCTSSTGNCAAYRCRAISPDWYLPAKFELQSVIFALCPGSVYPCSFGDFTSTTYWSSTQWFAYTNAFSVDVPDGNYGPGSKWTSKPVRCIRSF